MSLWSAGAGIIVWLAGLQSIPGQLYEAAAIDGAGAWRRFWNVTVPMLSPYILFNFIVGVIATMQIFNEAFVMTQGGPADSTLFYSYYLFRQAFQYFRMGYASALAWLLFVVVLVFGNVFYPLRLDSRDSIAQRLALSFPILLDARHEPEDRRGAGGQFAPAGVLEFLPG
jgi:ABC-type sugar transport system permease subunit